jgi:hypothetical protein
MARIQRISASAPVTVEQEQLVNASNFQFSTAEAAALKEVGQRGSATVQKIQQKQKQRQEAEQKVQVELQKRKAAAENSLSISKIGASRQQAKASVKQFMADNPDPSTWNEGTEKAIIENGKFMATQPLTTESKAEQDAKQDAFDNELRASTELASTKATIDDDITVSGASLIDTIGNDDGLPVAAADMLESLTSYKEALERKYPKDVVEQMMEETIQEGKEQKKQNVKEDIENLAVATPAAVTKQINDELEARKKGEGSEELRDLDNTDLEGVKDYAKTIGEKQKDQSEVITNQTITDNYASISEGDTNVAQMVADINNNPAMSAEGKIKAIEKTRTFFSGWHSTEMATRTWPLVDDDDTIQALNTTLTEQSSGQIDITEANEIINTAANSGKLTKATRDSLRVKSQKGGNDAIDKATSSFTSRVRNALTGRFTDRVARAKIREAAVGVDGLSRSEKNEIQTANYLLSVSYDQLHRYTADLDAALREVKGGKETVSGVEATAIAASVWEKYKTKTTSQRIGEFQAFTGGNIPQPEGFNTGVWRTATNKTRSKIIAAMERGLSVKEVETMVSK